MNAGEELFRALLDSLSVPAALLDRRGVVVAANRAWVGEAHRTAGRVPRPAVGSVFAEALRHAADEGVLPAARLLSALPSLLDGQGGPLAVEHDEASPVPRRVTFTSSPFAGGVLVTETEVVDPRVALLAEMGGVFVGPLDPETMLRNLARLSVPAVADCCFVDLVGNDRRLRRVAIAHVDHAKADLAWEIEARHPRGARETAGAPQVIRTGQPKLYAEVTEADLSAAARSPEHLERLRQLGLTSVLVVPLISRGRVLGAVTLAMGGSGRRLSPIDVVFASAIAERAAHAVDVTQMYREAQEANRMKDEFLATLSHELRTPLNSILGWAHVLKGSPLDPDVVARAVETIERNARAQTQLISDVLDVSRIVTGNMRLTVGPVELPLVIEAALETVRSQAATKEIRLETDVDPLAGPVSGDADRLQQVLGNLLSNAVKYTPKGGRVRLRLARVESHVEISVEDTGIGMGAEFLPHVFERFRQPEASTTRPHGGVGLGLALVRHLVELHGGTVEGRSPGRGRGSTFYVRLPLSGARSGALAPLGTPERRSLGRRSAREEATTSLSGVKVLVVDDEKDARDVVGAILEQRGAEVVPASSVAEALARLQETQPDVLLSDIGMPDEDGYSLMRRVRALPRDLGGGIPAAALTAYARGEDRMQALLAGYQVHVPKPVQPAELIAVVSSLAGRKNEAPA